VLALVARQPPPLLRSEEVVLQRLLGGADLAERRGEGGAPPGGERAHPRVLATLGERPRPPGGGVQLGELSDAVAHVGEPAAHVGGTITELPLQPARDAVSLPDRKREQSVGALAQRRVDRLTDPARLLESSTVLGARFRASAPKLRA
jgi:hypothetical protein